MIILTAIISPNHYFHLCLKKIKQKWKDFEHEEMKEESHQLELKSNYAQDEEFEESDD